MTTTLSHFIFLVSRATLLVTGNSLLGSADHHQELLQGAIYGCVFDSTNLITIELFHWFRVSI